MSRCWAKREKNDNTFIAVTDIKVVKDENVQCAHTHKIHNQS